jgi:hypothetical protein
LVINNNLGDVLLEVKIRGMFNVTPAALAADKESNDYQKNPTNGKTNSQSNVDIGAATASTRGSMLEIFVVGNIVKSTNVFASDIHTLVNTLKGLFDINKVGTSILSNLHVVVDGISSTVITVMNNGKNRGGKDSSLSFGLFGSITVNIGKVGISESSLNKRNGHKRFNSLLILLERLAFSSTKLALSVNEFTKDLTVDVGSSNNIIGEISTSLEVGASLIGKSVNHDTRSGSIGSL